MNETLPAYAAVLLSSIVIAAQVIAAHGADADAFSDTPDLKADVMRVYGVRCAKSVDDKTVKVVIGASCGPARAKAEAYRIVSELVMQSECTTSMKQMQIKRKRTIPCLRCWTTRKRLLTI